MVKNVRGRRHDFGYRSSLSWFSKLSARLEEDSGLGGITGLGSLAASLDSRGYNTIKIKGTPVNNLIRAALEIFTAPVVITIAG